MDKTTNKECEDGRGGGEWRKQDEVRAMSGETEEEGGDEGGRGGRSRRGGG